jgi:hypothetical protein
VVNELVRDPQASVTNQGGAVTMRYRWPTASAVAGGITCQDRYGRRPSSAPGHVGSGALLCLLLEVLLSVIRVPESDEGIGLRTTGTQTP